MNATGPKHQQLLKKNLNEFNAPNNVDIIESPDPDHEKSKSTRSGFEVVGTSLKLTFQPQKKKKLQSIKRRKRKDKCGKIMKWIDRYFMLLILVIIPLAYTYPIGHNDGPLYPEITSSWIATIILFFLLGLGIKLEYLLLRWCLFWEMNLFAHIIIFIYYPFIGFSMYLIAHEFPESSVSDAMMTLIEGIVILCALPATAASAVVFTTNAYGNEAAAAINCTLSNLLGLIISPALILLFKSTKMSVNVAQVVYKLSLRVIAPFILGQLIRVSIGEKGRDVMKTMKVYIKKMNEICLLYMIFCALSDTFYIGIHLSLTTEEIATFIVMIVLLHTHGYLVIWYMHLMFMCCMDTIKRDKSQLKRSIYDRVACVYCGVSKTIVLGIPLIETIYGGTPNVGMYILAILVYHPSNLICGMITVEPFKRKVLRERCTLSSYSGTEATAWTQPTVATDYGALTPYAFDPHDSFRFMPFAAHHTETEQEIKDSERKKTRGTRPMPRPQYY